jgi:hypothetical protein
MTRIPTVRIPNSYEEIIIVLLGIGVIFGLPFFIVIYTFLPI